MMRRMCPGLPQVIDQFDIPAVAQLFEETDFVGMSSYPSLSPRFTPDQLENALWQFAREIKYFGVNLEKVRRAHNSRLRAPDCRSQPMHGKSSALASTQYLECVISPCMTR